MCLLMRTIFTNSRTELEFFKSQTLYGHTHDVQLEDFLSRTYAPGTLMQRRFKYVVDTFLSGRPKDVLEIGAGCGDLSVFASTLYPDNRYTVSDLSKDLLDRFFSRTKKWFKSEHDFKLAYCAAENMPFADENFDVVLVKSAVHHFEDFEKAFSEIRRILRKGGVVVCLNDPVCFNIPIYREIRDLTFAFSERIRGNNCRIYPFAAYMKCGDGFSSAKWEYDPASMEDIVNNESRNRLKKMLFSYIKKSRLLFGWFFAWRFNSYIFYFMK
jgi:ubiquinone/menaquinone biosynthesis C-methylase UbiE